MENLDVLNEKREEQLQRHRIADAYLSLLKEKEANKISVTELAKAAGVSRMAFYRKFEDVESVVDFYLGGIMHWEVAYNPETGEDYDIYDVRFGIRFFEAMKRHREEILLLVMRGYSHTIVSSINRTNECAGGDMAMSSIDRYRLYFLSGAGFNVMLVWLRGGCKETPEEMAGAMDRFLAPGLLRGES